MDKSKKEKETMKVYNERRECYVLESLGYFGYFHCWMISDKNETKGIVEMLSGQIALVDPENIQFVDMRPDVLQMFNKEMKKFDRENGQLLEKNYICGITLLECIRCMPGACGNRLKQEDRSDETMEKKEK